MTAQRVYNARSFSMIEVEQNEVEHFIEEAGKQQQKADWLQIYCALIQGRSSEVNLSRITPTGFVEATNMLFEAYKQKWDNSDA